MKLDGLSLDLEQSARDKLAAVFPECFAEGKLDIDKLLNLCGEYIAPDVKMFFKIPRTFKIETPIGTYNPDWAVYLDRNGEKKLYFVLETKGDLNEINLRAKEALKIHCGKQHFKALDNGVELSAAREWKEFKVKI